MKFVLFIVLFSFVAFSFSADSGNGADVRVGDSTAAVRSHLGEPNIEFPLNGQLVQDYGYCVIVSSNGVVMSIRQRSDEKPARKPSKPVDPAAPTVKGLLAKARAGDAESQYCLAYCYQVGKVVTKNMDEAIRWYTLAAMQGHMASQHNLGVIYMKGEGVPCDYEQAYVWAALAADNGNDQLLKILQPCLTETQTKAALLRAQRIRNGLEESPYGTPDASTAIAHQNSSSTDQSTD